MAQIENALHVSTAKIGHQIWVVSRHLQVVDELRLIKVNIIILSDAISKSKQE